MRIVCDNCGAKYQISDEKVRNKVFKIRCKKCSHVIIVRGGQQEQAAQPHEQAAQVAAAHEHHQHDAHQHEHDAHQQHHDQHHHDPQPASTDESTRVAPYGGEAAAEPAAPAPDAIWYVVVNRQQVGPLSPADVEARFRAGEVDADTFTWAEGMSDWVRLATVTEFTHLFPAPEAAAPAAVVAAAPAAGASVFAGADEDEDVMVSDHSAANEAPAPNERLFSTDAEESVDVSSARVGSSNLRSQRNENSVLFSLDSLSQDVGGGGGGQVSNTGGSEGSGLIDISALGGGGGGFAAGGGGATASAEAFGGGGGGVGIAAPAPVIGAPSAPRATMVARPRRNTGMVVGIVVGLFGIIAAAGAFFMMKGDDEKQPPQLAAATGKAAAAGGENKPVKVGVGAGGAEKATDKPGEGEKPAEAAKPAEGEKQAEGEQPAAGEKPAEAATKTAAAAAKKPATRRTPSRRGSTSRAAPRNTRSRAEDAPPPAAAPRPAAAPKPKPAPRRTQKKDEVDDLLSALDGDSKPKPSRRAASPTRAPAAPADDPMLPATLNKRQILGVVRKNVGKINSCKGRNPDAKGVVTVRLTVQRSGSVSAAKVVGGKFKGTPAGNCVSQAVRTYRFPRFSGDPMTFNLPFSL